MDKQVNVYLRSQHLAKIPLEFTGRWRVVSYDSTSRLELECFALFPHEVVISYEDVKTLVYKPNWLKRLFGYEPIYTSERVYTKKNKLIDSYGYVSDSSLVVEEVYNNVCGE